jgi:hypothetical protein
MLCKDNGIHTYNPTVARPGLGQEFWNNGVFLRKRLAELIKFSISCKLIIPVR